MITNNDVKHRARARDEGHVNAALFLSPATKFLFPFPKPAGGRFVLITDFSHLSTELFSFLIHLRAVTFSLKGSALGLLVGMSELPASPLLHFGDSVRNCDTTTQAL